MAKQILVVHDDQLFLTMMELRLGMEGFRAITCRSFEEGIRLFEHLKPDLVLLSSEIPEMSPENTFERMQAINPDCRIVLIDVGRSMAATDGSESSEMDGVFKKLGQFEMLITNIKSAFESGAYSSA